MGWIKLHTKITEWRWWRDLPTRAVWLEILVRANWKDTEWGKTIIPRGSFVTSREHLADLCGLSVMQVRRALDNLQKAGEINRKITNKYIIISICKYDDYQVPENTAQPANNRQTTGKQPANNRQTTGKQPQHKNIRREEYNNTSINKSIYINTLTSSNECVGGAGGMPTEVGQTIPIKPPKTLAEIDDDLRDRARTFAETLAPFVSIYGRQMVKDFWDYWTEPNKSHTRMRFELERTWDVSRRLGRWSRNNNNMSRTNGTNVTAGQPESRYAAAAAQAERMKQYLEPEQPKEETIEDYEQRKLKELSGV